MGDKDKKGQSLTLGTIILIVLGVIVLVFLIWGFANGWGTLWDKILAFGGGGSTVDTIAQSCAIACTTGSINEFCSLQRTVKIDATTEVKGYSCSQLVEGKEGIALGIIQECPSIKCTGKEPSCLNQSGTELAFCEKNKNQDICLNKDNKDNCTWQVK